MTSARQYGTAILVQSQKSPLFGPSFAISASKFHLLIPAAPSFIEFLSDSMESVATIFAGETGLTSGALFLEVISSQCIPRWLLDVRNTIALAENGLVQYFLSLLNASAWPSENCMKVLVIPSRPSKPCIRRTKPFVTHL
jgi:hypothetical protein